MLSERRYSKIVDIARMASRPTTRHYGTSKLVDPLVRAQRQEFHERVVVDQVGEDRGRVVVFPFAVSGAEQIADLLHFFRDHRPDHGLGHLAAIVEYALGGSDPL